MLKWIAVVIFVLCVSGICFADEIDDLIPSIIQVESGGNPEAYNSSSGAIGLMQITSIVFEEWKKEHIKGILPSPDEYYIKKWNTEIGNWYLRRLKNHYLKDKYTIERLLCAYNWGIRNLRKVNYDVSKSPKETRNYIKKVLYNYNKKR